MSIRPFLLAALCAAVIAPASATEGQKLDSGLGDLPHYSQWADKFSRLPVVERVAVNRAVHVPGESLDSGLGELPHFRYWADKFARSPAARPAQVASR